MIVLTSSNLRALADLLDGLADIERNTELQFVSHSVNSITIPSVGTVDIRRVDSDPGPAFYTVEIREG